MPHHVGPYGKNQWFGFWLTDFWSMLLLLSDPDRIQIPDPNPNPDPGFFKFQKLRRISDEGKIRNLFNKKLSRPPRRTFSFWKASGAKIQLIKKLNFNYFPYWRSQETDADPDIEFEFVPKPLIRIQSGPKPCKYLEESPDPLLLENGGETVSHSLISSEDGYNLLPCVKKWQFFMRLASKIGGKETYR